MKRKIKEAYALLISWLKELAGERPTWRHWLLMAVICWLTVLCVESRLLALKGIHLGSQTDAISTHYPVRDYIHQWVKKGVIPLWEPHLFNGQPLQTGLRPIINPALLLTLATPDIQTEMRYSVFVHLFLAHFGAILWLRSWGFNLVACWLGSAAAMLTGFQQSHLFAGHYDILSNIAWVPWLMWSLRLALLHSGMGWSLLCILFWLFLMTSGHYHIVYLTLWFIGAEFLLTLATRQFGVVSAWNFRNFWGKSQSTRESSWFYLLRGLLRIAFLGVAVAGLNTWQLLPSLETVSLSVRGSGLYEHAIAYGAHPLAWLSLFIPHLYQGTVELWPWCGWIMWEGQGYVGILALLLTLYGVLESRPSRWLAHVFLALFATWLAMGDFAGLFKIYYKFDPFLGLFRVPSRFIWPATLALGWLTAHGAHLAIQSGFATSRWTKRLLIMLLSINVLVWTVTFYQEGTTRWWLKFVAKVALATDDHNQPPENAVALYGLTWTRYSNTVFLLGLFAYICWRVPKSYKTVVLSLATVGELTQFSRVYQQVVTDDHIWLSPEVLQFIEGHPTNDRFCSDPNLQWQNHFGAYGLSEVTGYENMMGVDYAREVLRQTGQQPGTMITVYSSPVPCGLHRIQSTRFYVQTIDYNKEPNHPDAIHFQGLAQIHINDTNMWFYMDRNALPRVYFAPGARRMSKPGLGFRELEGDMLRTRINVNLDAQNMASLVKSASKQGFRLKELSPSDFRLPKEDSMEAFEKLGIGQIEKVDIRPNNVLIRCQSLTQGVVVMTDSPWSGWRVKVDGQERNLLVCDAELHRGVFVTPGRHLIEFYYWPESLTAGIETSRRVALALTFFFLGCWLSGKMRPLRGESHRAPTPE